MKRPSLIHDDAFTLIELLVVIMIIALLIAVSVPSFIGQTQKAHDSAAEQQLMVAYKEAKATAIDADPQGSFSRLAIIDALQASAPAFNVVSGEGDCTASGEITNDPAHVVVDAATDADNLILCNGSGSNGWVLTVSGLDPSPTYTHFSLP